MKSICKEISIVFPPFVDIPEVSFNYSLKLVHIWDDFPLFG